MKKRTKEQLQKIVAAGYEARNELQEIEAAEKTRENRPLIGKCQKYLNSYGSGEKWWLYRRIIGVDGDWVTAFSFQTCSMGKTTIEIEKHGTAVNSGFEEITEREFNAAYREMQKSVSAAYHQR